MDEINIIGNDIWFCGYKIGTLNETTPASIISEFLDKYNRRTVHRQNWFDQRKAYSKRK